MQQLDATSFPPNWNYNSDIVVIVAATDDAAAAVTAVKRLGARRVLVYGRSSTIQSWTQAIIDLGAPSAWRLLIIPMPEAPDVVSELREAFDALIYDQWLALHTQNLFSRTWVEQSLTNLHHLPKWPTVFDIRGLQGKPLIIVGAGPSLEKNIGVLRELKGRAVLLAVGQAARAMVEAGVLPDLVMVLDAGDHHTYFTGLPTEKLSLILPTHAHPDLFDLPVKRIFTYGPENDMSWWCYLGVKQPPIMLNGGSVSTAAYALGVYLSMKPIVLVGQDHAYGDDDKFYAFHGSRAVVDHDTIRAEGWSAEELARHTLDDLARPARLVMLPGYDGKDVRSDTRFASFVRWFERAISLWPQTRVINATEGGAHIAGTTRVPLTQICANEPFDVEALLDAAVARDRSAWVDSMSMWRARSMTQLDAVEHAALSGDTDGLAEILPPVKWCQMLRFQGISEAARDRDTQRLLSIFAEAAADARRLLGAAP